MSYVADIICGKCPMLQISYVANFVCGKCPIWHNCKSSMLDVPHHCIDWHEIKTDVHKVNLKQGAKKPRQPPNRKTGLYRKSLNQGTTYQWMRKPNWCTIQGVLSSVHSTRKHGHVTMVSLITHGTDEAPLIMKPPLCVQYYSRRYYHSLYKDDAYPYGALTTPGGRE